MLRLSTFTLLCFSLGMVAAPLPVKQQKMGGILVLDDCDEEFRGKETYRDNLTFLDLQAKQKFRVSGLNTCQGIGSSRLIAVDPARKSIWVVEMAANQIRRFDYEGKETLKIADVHASSVAVDPETGNIWIASGGRIGNSKILMYDVKGERLGSHPVSGWDIVYDHTSKSFWIAEAKLTKIKASSGEITVSLDVAKWCCSSLDVDPKSGDVWVAVRGYSPELGDKNLLVKYNSKGEQLHSIDLGLRGAMRVSVSPKDGSAWIARFNKSIEQFSSNGKSLAVYEMPALAVQVDPSGEDVWVATQTDVRRVTPKGEVLKKISHEGKTRQAWLAVLD